MSGPMVRVAGQQGGGAVKLLGKHQADEHMWEGEWTERPVLVGASQYFGGVTVRTANQEGKVASGHPPRGQLRGQFLARPRLAATIQGHHVGIARQGGK